MQCRFNTLKATMFIGDDSGFPCLKGKAAEIRHLAPALLFCFDKYADKTNQQQRQVSLMLGLIVKMEQILDDHALEFRFSDQAHADFRKCVYAFVQLNSELANHFHTSGVKLFNHTVKFHYMLHIAEVSAYMNPRLGWCYSGEDYMRKAKTLVQGSHRGTPPALVVSKVMRKYAVAFSLSLRGYEGMR